MGQIVEGRVLAGDDDVREQPVFGMHRAPLPSSAQIIGTRMLAMFSRICVPSSCTFDQTSGSETFPERVEVDARMKSAAGRPCG